MYHLKTQVRYSECDTSGHLSLPAIVNNMQDCAVAHAISVGRGPALWMKEKQSWVITSWQIVIDKYPALNEKIDVATWPYRFHGAEGDRNFTIKNQKGEHLAYARSVWVYYDFQKQRPMRIPQAEIDAFTLAPPYDMEASPRHIKLPEEGFKEHRKIKIRRTNLDTNGHVNNEQYILLALAHVKSENPVRELRVQYIRQARLGDLLTPVVKRTEEETYVWFMLEGQLCAIMHCMHQQE